MRELDHIEGEYEDVQDVHLPRETSLSKDQEETPPEW